MFLLDTNAIAEPLRPEPHPPFLRRFQSHSTELAIASTTWHEALYGVKRMPDGKRKRAVYEYLHDVVHATMTILPYDEAAAEWHAEERARLGARGRNVPFADGQIAAVAAVHGLTVVTANVRDFAHFGGLRVENWMK